LDPTGGVALAWKMNGQELLPDHGYPVRKETAVLAIGDVEGVGFRPVACMHLIHGVKRWGGGLMLAWEMIGKELLPDHGYPVRKCLFVFRSIN
jgi:DMSO/TMAO reductase YedYZ molybdopterin-dependent catalytic subunit